MAIAAGTMLLACGQVTRDGTGATSAGGQAGSGATGGTGALGGSGGSAGSSSGGGAGTGALAGSGGAVSPSCLEPGLDPSTSIPKSWPAFSGRWPDSPTLTCAGGPCPLPGEEGYGQDGNHATGVPAYAATPETLADSVTGLIWQRAAAPALDVTGAEQYCQALELAGYDDWRLPSRLELLSLLDYGIDPPGLPQELAAAAALWSGTHADGWSTLAWLLVDGSFAAVAKSEPYPSRCVRGQVLGGSIAISEDATVVFDSDSGLWWQREIGCTGLWTEALAHCDALELGGHDDWRLASAKEIQTLFGELIDSGLTIDTIAFPSNPSQQWTSSGLLVPHGGEDCPGIPAYAVQFDNLSLGAFGCFEQPWAARCVRGGP